MPVGTREFVRFGGDTTCYSVHRDDGRLVAIVDAGTGLRLALDHLTESAQVPVLLTHYHWDHIQGLSMCAPIWNRTVTLDFHGPFDTRAAIGEAISPPWFPVSIVDMDVNFHPVEPSFRLDDVNVTSFPLNHPQGGVGYRFDLDGESIVVATDHEAGTSLDGPLLEASQGADLLVHDAQYLPDEIGAKQGWGHSTWEQAVKLAGEAGVRKVLFASHDPTRTDDDVDDLVQRARERFPDTWAGASGERYSSR